MPYSDKNLLRDKAGIIIPQFFDETTDDFKPLKKTMDVQLTGSFVALSTEPKPTVSDGLKDGDTLMLVDTAQVFKHYKGQWYEL